MALDLSKYGATSQPTQAPKSTGLDLTKYGAKPADPIAQPPAQPSAFSGMFGNPLETINQAGRDVNAAISGTDQYEGKAPLVRGFAAARNAAVAVPNVAADVIPGARQALDFIGKGYMKAIEIAGNVPNYLADAAQAVGVMSPEQRKQYNENNAAFAGSPIGYGLEAGFEVLQNTGDIAGVIAGAHGTARLVQNFVDKVPQVKQQMADNAQAAAEAKQMQLVREQSTEIANIENRYAAGRKANDYSKDAGHASRERIAQSNVLKHSIDEDGLIRTKQPGGAVEQYKAMTLKPAEGVVRNLLEREGGKTNISEVRAELMAQVRASGLKGADLQSAIRGVNTEIAGLRLDADPLGYIQNTVLHDAKVNHHNHINYQTPLEIKAARKAYARAYRTLIEQKAQFDVKGINRELGKYLEDIERLESLDGYRVKGGRLGKYSAQIAGNVVGGAFGSMFGPVGTAVGAVVGGEVSGIIKGQSMSKTFKDTGTTAPKNPILDKAVEDSKAPRLMLPANTSGLRSQKTSTAPINLGPRSQSTVDTQEKSLGKRKTK